MYVDGINPLLSYTVSLETPMPFRIGQRGKDQLGREYVFQNTVNAVTAGDVFMLALGNTGGATALTTAAAVYNRQVGICPVTFGAVATTGTGFWAQVQGATVGPGIRVSVAVSVNVLLYTSATASALAVTAAANNFVRGITLTTATGAAGVAAGLLNYPTIGIIAGTDA